jgi:hypothetical protein
MKLRKIFSSLAGLTENPNALFYAAVLAFLVDNVINYYVNVPLFVVFSMLSLPLLWINLIQQGSFPRFLLIFITVLAVSFAAGSIFYGLKKTNISDFLFILLFATSFFYYQKHKIKLSVFPVKVLTVVVIVMIGFGFFGWQSDSIYTKKGDYLDLELVGISFDSLKAQAIPFEEFKANFDESVNVDSLLRSRLKKYFPNRPEIDTMQMFGIRLLPNINFREKKSIKVENQREFRAGLFRIPHVAAYFLGALLFFYFALFRQNKNRLLLLFVAVLGFLMLYTGVRTFFIALFLSLALFLIVRKSIWYLVVFMAMLFLVVMLRYEIFLLAKDTFLEPFALLILRMVDEPEQISRVVLIQSWWLEIREFGTMQWLTGKTLYESKMANLANLFSPVWYHNDFLSVLYAYGAPALVLYIVLFIKMYRFMLQSPGNSSLIILFYLTLVMAAFINGLYYYFPVILLYIFILMTQNLNKTE